MPVLLFKHGLRATRVRVTGLSRSSSQTRARPCCRSQAQRKTRHWFAAVSISRTQRRAPAFLAISCPVAISRTSLSFFTRKYAAFTVSTSANYRGNEKKRAPKSCARQVSQIWTLRTLRLCFSLSSLTYRSFAARLHSKIYSPQPFFTELSLERSIDAFTQRQSLLSDVSVKGQSNELWELLQPKYSIEGDKVVVEQGTFRKLQNIRV